MSAPDSTGPLRGRTCRSCGFPEVNLERPGRWELLREWLGGGQLRMLRSMRIERCADCGETNSRVYGHGAYRKLTLDRWWQLPARLISLLRNRRAIEPNPIFYGLVTAVGAVVGVLADLTFDVPWWSLAVAAPLAVAAGTLAAPLFDPADRRRLAIEILRLRRPLEAMERDLAEEERRWREADLPLFGLPPSWGGLRTTGGIRRRNDEVTAVELSHRPDSDRSAPDLRVETVDIDRDIDRSTRGEALVRAELVSWLADRGTYHTIDRDAGDDPAAHITEWRATTDRIERSLQARPWHDRQVDVAGIPTSFTCLELDRCWVAYAPHEGYEVRIRSDRIHPDDVELVHVDIDPYLAGTRRLRNAWITDEDG